MNNWSLRAWCSPQGREPSTSRSIHHPALRLMDTASGRHAGHCVSLAMLCWSPIYDDHGRASGLVRIRQIRRWRTLYCTCGAPRDALLSSQPQNNLTIALLVPEPCGPACSCSAASTKPTPTPRVWSWPRPPLECPPKACLAAGRAVRCIAAAPPMEDAARPITPPRRLFSPPAAFPLLPWALLSAANLQPAVALQSRIQAPAGASMSS